MAQKKLEENTNAINHKMDDKDNQRRKERSSWGALILIVIGTIFLLQNYGYLDVDLSKLWPLILIIIGLSMLFKR